MVDYLSTAQKHDEYNLEQNGLGAFTMYSMLMN